MRIPGLTLLLVHDLVSKNAKVSERGINDKTLLLTLRGAVASKSVNSED
jgi:hypothetical protein